MMEIPVKNLSEPFPVEAIKQRKGNFGNVLDYAESSTVIQRLNDVLEGRWSFEILNYQVDPDEVIVKGQLTVASLVKQQFGGSKITRQKESGEPVSISDDLKAAASDCLKKCASLFGVGLYLYSSGNGHKPQRNIGNRNDRVTNKEITELFSTCKANGIPQSLVIKTAKEVYRKPISQLTSIEARNLIEQLT